MRQRRCNSGRDESGVALVEMAIVIPFLLLLIFGMVDFGIFLYRNIGLTQGVREAARQAAVANFDGDVAGCAAGTPTNNVVCAAKQRINVSGVKIYVLAPSNTVGSTFAVCATYKTTAIAGLTAPFIPKYMHAETIMRLEQAPTTGLAIAGGDADPENDGWSSCKQPT
jgi:Flp pilus assembly protein TadG